MGSVKQGEKFIRKFIMILITSIIAFGCDKRTPVEMLYGKWQVIEVFENGNNITGEYEKDHSPYLVLNEKGFYSIGLIERTPNKSWIADEKENLLILTEGGLFEDLKNWKVKASDNQLVLLFEKRAIRLKLKRIQDLPQPKFTESKDLVGKWTVDRVTINGLNSTDNYTYPDRWIILAGNGRFYNGAEKGDQNTGFWNVNEFFSKVEFRSRKKQDDAAISFYISENYLWYEKQIVGDKDNTIRIYFKKEGES